MNDPEPTERSTEGPPLAQTLKQSDKNLEAVFFKSMEKSELT